MISRLVIVRHGNTFGSHEVSRRIGAKSDLPLVASGRAQAERLAEWFAARSYRFDRVLCSPLQRTLETANILVHALKDPPAIELSDLLVEIDHGVDEGSAETEILARIGGEALAAWDEHGISPPGWTVDRNGRLAAWAELLTAANPPLTLLVTSNGAARFALLADPSLRAQASSLTSLKLRTGAFGIIDIDSGRSTLTAWNERP